MRRGEAPERGTIVGLVALAVLVGGEGKLVGSPSYPCAKVALAFGNKIALTADHVSIEATCASALPKKYKFSGIP